MLDIYNLKSILYNRLYSSAPPFSLTTSNNKSINSVGANYSLQERTEHSPKRIKSSRFIYLLFSLYSIYVSSNYQQAFHLYRIVYHSIKSEFYRHIVLSKIPSKRVDIVSDLFRKNLCLRSSDFIRGYTIYFY